MLTFVKRKWNLKCCQPFLDRHPDFVFFGVLLIEITRAKDEPATLGFTEPAWLQNMQTRQFKINKLVKLKYLGRRSSTFH